MRPTGCISLQYDMCTPVSKRALHFTLLVMISMRDGNITGAVIQVVANSGPTSACTVYDPFERIGRLRLSSMRMLSGPRIHLGDMLG